MKRIVVLAVALVALALPALAGAHPLGNFTTNRYDEVVVSGDRIYVLAVVDLAEIPTFQAKAERTRLGREGYAARVIGEIVGGLTLTAAGEPRELRAVEHSLEFSKGAGGLPTTRLAVVFDAGAARDGEITLVDSSYRDRVGWREIVVSANRGASITTSAVPARSISDRLRVYPGDLLESPSDVRAARAEIVAGDQPGVAPRPQAGPEPIQPRDRSGGFASLIEQDDPSVGFILAALALALFWGAAHALTPGHGKAMVAAYLVGTRGTPRHAFLLGGTVTIAHTAGVFALGFVTLGLSAFIVPEQLYPWLTLVSGLLVVLVGASVLRQRVRSRDRHHHHHDDHHGHDHSHHDHSHHHHHHHEYDDDALTSKGILGVGVAAGLLPCPSALVVLLSAIALHRIGLGLALIVAFSFGLASTITAIGLVAVLARRAFGRLSLDGPLVRALPAVSAALIVTVGLVITARALPGVI